MATVTPIHALPAAGHSRISGLWTRATVLAKRARIIAAPVLERHRSRVMTIAGLASIDASAWQVAHAFGWLAIGVSILLYDAFGREKPAPKPGERP